MIKVLLVNQQVTANLSPVSGKSTKLYGNAIFDPAMRGVVFAMTVEEYEAAKFDIVGNTQPMQQWVPTIVIEPDPDVPRAGRVLPTRKRRRPRPRK